jgi:hypothetical protein
LFYGFDDLFDDWGFFNNTWSWDGITGWGWGNDGWGSDGWGSIGGGSNWGSGVSGSQSWGSSVSVSSISSSKSSWVETTITSISSWVVTFSGGGSQYGSENEELVHFEGV